MKKMSSTAYYNLMLAQGFIPASATPVPIPVIQPLTQTQPQPKTWAVSIPESLRTAPWMVVDVETTHLTPGSVPLPELRNAPAGTSVKPRLRIVTCTWPEGTEAWDMDTLLPHQTRDLLKTVLTCPLLIGHNFGFDLYWIHHAYGLDAPMPVEVIDTKVLARFVRPDIPVRLAEKSMDTRHTPKSLRSYAESFLPGVESKRGQMWSLASCAFIIAHGKMEKDLQTARNWTLPAPLSDEHYAYATGDTYWTHLIWSRLCGGNWEAWKTQNTLWEDLMSTQTQNIVVIRENGLPFSARAFEGYREKMLTKAKEQALLAVSLAPEILSFRNDMCDPSKGETDAFKLALASALTRMGVKVPHTNTGGISVAEGAMKLAGAFDNSASKPFITAIFASKKALTAVAQARKKLGYAERSADGLIHSLLGPGAVTGRLTSQEPNIENFPRDPAFRAIVEAPEGSKILSCDYSGVELRIAAALAIRAQREAKNESWAVYLRESGERVSSEEVETARLKYLVEEDRDARNWDRLMITQKAYRTTELRYVYGAILDGGQGEEYSVMRNVFRSGGDIHTYTALSMLGQDTTPALDPMRVKILNEDLVIKPARQAAKPLNFGLLYSMQAAMLRSTAKTGYDVDMTLEEATEERLAWLRMYPEIRFWQLWTLLSKPERQEKWMGISGREGFGIRKMPVYHITTLSGRKFTTWDDAQAMNYQDQGTGADIIMAAVEKLRKANLLRYVSNQIHDELLLVVPDAEVERVSVELQEIMVEAGDEALNEYGVPAKVELKIGQHWVH